MKKSHERTVMGRKVIHHSPARHPTSKDPLARQPMLDWVEGGPVATEGSESYLAQKKQRSRVGGFGKKGYRGNPYGSGSVN